MPGNCSRERKLFHLSVGLLTTAVIGVALYFYKCNLEEETTTQKPIPPRQEKKPVTIAMNNTLIWNPSSDTKSPVFAFTENAIPYLRGLLSRHTVHLIIVVTSDAQQSQILGLLSNSGLYKCGLDRRRILFCDTNEGKNLIVRHISPDTHIDCAKDDIIQLSKHIPKVVFVQKASIKTPSTHPYDTPLIYPEIITEPSSTTPTARNIPAKRGGLAALSKSNSYTALSMPKDPSTAHKQQTSNDTENLDQDLVKISNLTFVNLTSLTINEE